MYEHPNGSPIVFMVLGRTAKVHEDERSGRPVTATDNAAVAAVRNVVEADRRVTIDEIVIRLPPGIDIGRSSIGTIMSDVLKFRKVCARWVPRLHSENHKQQRVEAARAFLEMNRRAVEPTGVTRCVSGRSQLVELLLSRGARPFLSTAGTDSQTYGSAPQRGCHSAIAAAASHGQRSVVHLLLSHPTAAHDMLSLEEILAEGFSTAERRIQVVKMTRAQLKALQEAMYQSAENTFLEITLDLRNLATRCVGPGVPWSLHCWLSTLATAHDRGLETVVDQLLRDFLQGWPEDGPQFGEEGLPLLFSIFRHCKV
ncbi:ABTB2 [Cordylochernes scorpioides]|uniref:ABTB2 n=1 Tax=Cordylochernes scorpioides TaxID=51811 RepID=A0ABY6L942_9ARAC|nr:ABTB2 [Cordylochernes scorpioides]